ncbi:unnamed protein product, partial [Cyprideis torosa]
MGDGVNAGDNMRASIITRGLSELTRLGVAMGGKRRTFAGLAGMGDLVATCSSTKSRNYHASEKFYTDEPFKDVHPEIINLFTWHAIEEIEHKDVAFDVMRH